MARVIGPLNSGQASGLAGQVLYLPCGSGTNAGKRSCEHISLNTGAANARANWKAQVDAWSQLSASDRDSWAAAAGSPAAAFNRFVANRIRLAAIDLPLPDRWEPTSILGNPHQLVLEYCSTDPRPLVIVEVGDTPPDHVGLVYAAITTLRRARIDRHKFTRLGCFWSANTAGFFTVPHRSRFLHVRVEYIDPYNGDRRSTHTAAPVDLQLDVATEMLWP